MKSFKKVLSEVIIQESNDSAIKAIAKLTDRNAHSAALTAGAKLIKNKKLESIFRGIEGIHDAYGSMPAELNKFRTTMTKELMAAAKQKLSPEEFKAFNGAY